jgi:endonuclease YncB( thermonuclease family)
VFIIVIPQTSLAWKGEVVEVPEGDILIMRIQGREKLVKLHGIDCPEKGQPFFDEAKVLTSFLVLRKFVEAMPISKGAYGVTAMVKVPGQKQSVNKQLVAYGMAWVSDKHAAEEAGQSLKQLEKLAKRNKIGLWSRKNPVPPWEWRRSGAPKK